MEIHPFLLISCVIFSNKAFIMYDSLQLQYNNLNHIIANGKKKQLVNKNRKWG